MTNLLPPPTPWHDMWLYLGILYTEEEMTAKYDYIDGTWHERVTVEPVKCGKADGYCAGCEKRREIE